MFEDFHDALNWGGVGGTLTPMAITSSGSKAYKTACVGQFCVT